MKKDHNTAAASGGMSPETSPPPELSPREALEAALKSVGLDEDGALAFCDAAQVVGAMTQGRRSSQVELGFRGASAQAADEVGGRPREDAAPRSLESHLSEADKALTAMEAIASCSMRLDAALVVATREQTTAVGSGLLAQRDVADPSELSKTAQERWRSRSKKRTREEIVPAIGWTPGETVHLVGMAMAPVAFSMPVVAQMSRGLLPWRLARSLWRACESLDAADAAHIATVMCGDDIETCVPERLTPDGSVSTGPWEHRAFYNALAREVAKITGADDADPADAEAERAAREAAYEERCVFAKVHEDGTGSLTLITSAFWVGAIKDRLSRASRTARLSGDQRTLDQLESDIARTLLAHAIMGFADLPIPRAADGTQSASPTDEDLIRAGWTPELVQALSGLPPALLQVIVPLLGLHDPATADTLPTTGRASTRPDPNTPNTTQQETSGTDTDTDAGTGAGAETGTDTGAGTGTGAGADAGAGAGTGSAGAPGTDEHTGRTGCPNCTPTARTRPADEPEASSTDTQSSSPEDPPAGPDQEPVDGAVQNEQDGSVPEGQDGSVQNEQDGSAQDEQNGSVQNEQDGSAQDEQNGSVPDEQDAQDLDSPDEVVPPRRRRLWVGELLGAFGMFLSPSQVRELALAPGTTMARLLVDPADGRCVERSIGSYRLDAAMRAQLLAADVTCRAPGCHHTGSACQIDHVTEYGTPGGVTSESNGQLLHTGHHEPKTAKDWDAELAANRDVTWTSLLGRIYRTRAFDYRRYVTLLVDAIDTVRSAPLEDQADELNRQVYLALTHRDLGERLNAGDDDLEPDIVRFEGWPMVRLTHRDPDTGKRRPGPSSAAVTEVLASWATGTGATQTSTTEPDTAKPDPAEIGTTRTSPAATDNAETGTTRTSPAATDTAESGSVQKSTTQTGTAETGTAKTDAADPEQGAETVTPEGRPSDRDDQQQGCPVCEDDHPRLAGPYDYHAISPPPKTSRRDWANHIQERFDRGEDCPPF